MHIYHTLFLFRACFNGSNKEGSKKNEEIFIEKEVILYEKVNDDDHNIVTGWLNWKNLFI